MIATKYNPREHGARCDICPLSKEGVVVPPTPAIGKLRLVVVGEGPGRVEEKMGMPFVGLSGKFLDERLRKDARVARADCHLTNAALCRGESDDDNERASECCAPRLLNELRDLPGDVPTALLGKTAVRSALGARNILTARGFIWAAPEIEEKSVKAAYKSKQDGILKGDVLRARQKLAGRAVLPSIHPAFVLRADTWKPISELDFRRIGRVVRGDVGGLLEDEVSYRVGGPEVLKGLGDVVSCDIETDGIKPLECNILSIGFADNTGHVVEIWPWSDEYAAAVSWHLGGKHEVVLHNGQNFDLLVLENHGVTW
jgi:uracil-DNA glycosylase family 4